MAQTGIVAWSQTAAENGTADSTVGMAEGMAPSAVNNGVRALMASAAKYRDDTSGSLTTSGTSTAYTLATNQVFSTLAILNGQELTVRFDQASGESPTLNVDSLGAKALQIDATNAVPTGFIAADSIWRITYDNSIPAFILNGVAQSQTLTTLTTTGDLTVGGDASVAGDSAVTGNGTIGGTLGVTGATTLTSLTTSGDGTVGGALAVTGASTLTGKLTANNSGGVVAKNTAKAFAYFTVSGTTVSFNSPTQGFNIASVTRTGSAVYSIAFTNALADANYTVNVTPDALRGGTVSNKSSTGFDITFYRIQVESIADPSSVSIVVFGL